MCFANQAHDQQHAVTAQVNATSGPTRAAPAPVDPGLAINARQRAQATASNDNIKNAAKASAAVRRSGAGLAIPSVRAGLQLPT